MHTFFKHVSAMAMHGSNHHCEVQGGFQSCSLHCDDGEVYVCFSEFCHGQRGEVS